MNRRQFLPLLGGAFFTSCRSEKKVTHWRGIAMGIEVAVKYHGSPDINPALAAVREAESALTLWEENSPFNQLNRSGVLKNPPAALLDCLRKSSTLYQASNGLFDPSIHSYLEWLKSQIKSGIVPDPSLSEKMLERVNFSRIHISEDEISLPPGMAISLNAIAQGYLTDVFASHFKADSALVHFGEYRVIGDDSWPVEVQNETFPISRALAVSSGSGQRLSATGSANHLIDPATGKSPPPKRVVAVEAAEAWLADGLSTIVAVGGEIPKEYSDAASRIWDL